MADLQSLSELYQNRLFRIPDYQRGYAWKQSQLVDFWDDIINLQENRYHYTGLLSLKLVPKAESKEWSNDKWLIDSGYKAYHIVDGQQRLTTFSILVNEIVTFIKNLDCFEGKSEEEIVICYQTLKSIREKYISQKRPPQNLITSYLFGYESDNPSAEYLIYKVYDEPYSGSVNETYYTQNLKYAKSFFEDCLMNLYKTEGLGGLESIFRKLTLQLMFNIHEIEDDYDVFVAFETMNNRGKKLTNLELLKNRLIYLTTLYSDVQLDSMDKTELRNQINDAWKEIYYQLGRNQHNPLSDDDFLRAHWIIYYQYSRKKGDDYIKFLLNKFSPKNIYEKKVVAVSEDVSETLEVDFDEEDDVPQPTDIGDFIYISELKPNEISAYVNSLKDVAMYWFYSHYPQFSDFSKEEKIWIERLNRIGIGYFRPLITAVLATNSSNCEEDRISLYKAIERFIFVSFRMATLQSSYKSSDYYRKTREVYFGEISINELTKSLLDTTTDDMDNSISSFITRMNKRFDDGEGFYGWRDLRYLLFEYELERAKSTGIEKLGWAPFTNCEKDKVSIEHILPQTPTKWYWRNQFRQFTAEEIRILSATLGNLLPLSQSVNSSLQNDSFQDKKKSKSTGRRGYEEGSHSELEVAHEEDWDANRILKRGLKILDFLEKRWGVKFKSEEQKIELLHIGFVNEDREAIPELEEEIVSVDTKEVKYDKVESNRSVTELQLDFWTNFVRYCMENGRGEDLATRKPYGQNWYDISGSKKDYGMFFSVVGKDSLRVGLYIYNIDAFKRLESKKELIEKACGFEMEWYTSGANSKAKRVLYLTTTELYNKEKYVDSFRWLIDSYDRLKAALESVDE